jgi:hypothetical protein
LIEQALFTKRPGRPWDDQPTAHTAGLDDSQSQELVTALSSLQGSLVPNGEAYETSFLPLSWGAFCVARIAPATGGGFALGSILAQCLVVDRDTLGRFANNPFTLLQAALSEGWLRSVDRDRPRLKRFTLEGNDKPLDASLVAEAIGDLGLPGFERLVDLALTNQALALPIEFHAPRLITALFNCLPVECRAGISFTTGLAVAEQTVFRMFGLEREDIERSLSSNERHFAVLELKRDPGPRQSAPSGWSGLVSQAIDVGRVDWLAEQLCISRPGLKLEMLDALGSELLQLLATLKRGEPTPPAAVEGKSSAFDDPGAVRRRPDGAHDASPSAYPQTAMAAVAVPARIEDDPSQVLGQLHPAAVQRLEQLDDVVFEAIAGKPTALEQLRELWPAVIAELGPELLDESQSQYLRHAMGVWKDCIDGDELRNPRLAVAAAEVVSILLGVT